MAPPGIEGLARTVAPLPIALTVVPDDGMVPRWLDVANTPYTTQFVDSYDYADASVTAALTSSADGLVITLSGTGLKPNFAYQIKLEGLPSVDPVANQTLGDLGRWWNGTGYLIAGYFVTDSSGSITSTASSQVWPAAAMQVDSSYHVLWTTAQRRPKRSDGPPISHTVVQTLWAYPVEKIGSAVSVYGGWEPQRPKPGTLVLPAGDYQCLLRLTEEGFHMTDASGAIIYGWKTVLDAPIAFTIDSVTPEPPPASTGSIAGTVTYEGGAAAKRVSVTLIDEAALQPIASARTVGNGAYSFGAVPTDATYTVSASDGSLSASESGLTVSADQTTTVNLTLQ